MKQKYFIHNIYIIPAEVYAGLSKTTPTLPPNTVVYLQSLALIDVKILTAHITGEGANRAEFQILDGCFLSEIHSNRYTNRNRLGHLTNQCKVGSEKDKV